MKRTWFFLVLLTCETIVAGSSHAAIRLARSIDGRRFADLGVAIFPSGDSPDLELNADGDLIALARAENTEPAGASSTWVVSKSADRGKTWSAPRPIVVHTEPGRPIELARASLVRTPGGRLRLFAVTPPKQQHSNTQPERVNTRRGAVIENPRVLVAESKDGLTFRARRKPVWSFDESNSPRITSATFAGRIHLFADGGDAPARRRSGDRRIEHRVSRDGRRFVTVQPSRIPDDVTIGSIIEARDGPRMYVSVGDAVRSYVSKDGRDWREERGVRMSAARSPAVVRLPDDTYLMAYVATRGDRSEPPSSETTASAPAMNPSAVQTSDQPMGDGASLTVWPADSGAEDEEAEADNAVMAAESDGTSDDATATRDFPAAAIEPGGPGFKQGDPQSAKPGGPEAPVVVLGNPGDDEEPELDHDDADDYAFAPRPDEQPNVDYIEWYRAQIPTAEADNAAADYEEIANDPRLKKPEEGAAPTFVDMFNSDHSGPPVPWDETDHLEWAESSTRVQDLVDKFHRASTRSNYAPPLRFDETALKTRKPLLIDLTLPDLASHRTLGKAMLADAWKKIDGRIPPERMMNAWRVVLRAANHLENRPTLIENLVSIAERRLVMENARWALKQEVLSSQEHLWEALELIRSLGRDKYDPAVAARGEFAMAAQFTQYMFSPPGPDGKPRLNPQHVEEIAPYFADWPEATPDLHDRLLAMTAEDYYATLDAFERVYREMADQLRVSYPEIRAADMDATQMDYLHTSPLTELLMPSFSRVMVLRARSETAFRATQLVYAVHLFHSQNDRWPKSINELESLNNLPRGMPNDSPRRAINEMRIDPFSGRDFGYRLDPDGPVIYSVSENAEDDGGIHSPRWGDGEKDENASDDFVFWPPQGPP